MTDDQILNKEDELILYNDTINNGFNKYRSGAISNDMREYKKNYMREYKKNLREYKKQYYQEHKEKCREYLRQWRIKKKQEKMALSEG